ncbi:MAG TPA: DNA-binding response regulator [Acetobacteraceae bacterium]|nr:DNA-binding response regulator [Acetobacteraceae bacterium]
MNFDPRMVQSGRAGTPFAPHVLMLGDVARGSGILVRTLMRAGAMVEEVADMPAVLARAQRHPLPDLVILEWEALATDEVAALRRLRDNGGAGAVLLLPPGSCSGERPDAVEPVEFLLAAAPAAERSESGLDLRLEVSRATWRGRRVDLSLSEFRIVSRLAAAPGTDVGHRELYDVTKGEGFVSGRGALGYRGNVRAAIKRIRQKFRRIDPEFAAIRSYHGFGYRWEEKEPTAAADAGRG